MVLTGRGTALLPVSALLIGAAEWGGHPVLRVLGAIGLGAVAAAVAVTARSPRAAVSRSVFPDRVERGRPAMAKLRVRNLGGGRQRAFTAWDRAGETRRTIDIRALGSGAEATYHYELPTGTRGLIEVGPLRLVRTDPFGLARNQRPAGETATLWVHPRRYPARARSAGFRRHHHEGATTDDALRGSLELNEVREYQPGDEVRHLHWKVTARTGRLMVRDYSDPDQPRFTLVLDTRTGTWPGPRFEEAVDLAASLVSAAAAAGHRTRLLTSGGMDVATAGGPLAVRHLLDELCRVGQAPAGALIPVSLSAARNQGGCLAVVTRGSSDLGGLAGSRARYSSLVLLDLASDAQPPALPGVEVLSAADAENAVRRWNEVAG